MFHWSKCSINNKRTDWNVPRSNRTDFNDPIVLWKPLSLNRSFWNIEIQCTLKNIWVFMFLSVHCNSINDWETRTWTIEKHGRERLRNINIHFLTFWKDSKFTFPRVQCASRWTYRSVHLYLNLIFTTKEYERICKMNNFSKF